MMIGYRFRGVYEEFSFGASWVAQVVCSDASYVFSGDFVCTTAARPKSEVGPSYNGARLIKKRDKTR